MKLQTITSEFQEIQQLTHSLPRRTRSLSTEEVSRREILLVAQAEISKAYDALQDGDVNEASFHFEIYQSCKVFIETYIKRRKQETSNKKADLHR